MSVCFFLYIISNKSKIPIKKYLVAIQSKNTENYTNRSNSNRIDTKNCFNLALKLCNIDFLLMFYSFFISNKLLLQICLIDIAMKSKRSRINADLKLKAS